MFSYCVMGMGMGINRVPSPTVPSFDHYQAHTPLGPLDMYVEETFEEEGEIEEVFAYDNQVILPTSLNFRFTKITRKWQINFRFEPDLMVFFVSFPQSRVFLVIHP